MKITEIIRYKVIKVTEQQDCTNYIKEVVIKRTYDECQTEIQTVYGQLQKILDVKIQPAPDKWDRLYNVDFIIEVKGKYIGLQIKPLTFEHTFEDYKWKEMQETSHQKFQKKFDGKVFIIFSVKKGKNKIIKNLEVIDEIKNEIERLKKL